ALADALLAEAEPGAGLLHDVLLDRVIEQLALARDALVVEDVELGLAERRSHLVLHHLDARAVADRALAFLERRDAPDVEPHRRVELECAPAGRGFGRVVNHDPVDEIGVVALDLDVEAMGRSRRRLAIALENPRRDHAAFLALFERRRHVSGCLGLPAVPHPERRRVDPGPPQRAISHGAPEQELTLVIGYHDVFDRYQDLVAHPELSGWDLTFGGKDHVTRSRGELPPARGIPLHLELQEVVGRAVVEPTDDLAGLDAPAHGIVREYFDRHLLVHNLADLLARPVRERHTGAVMEAPEHYADLHSDLVDEYHARPALRDRAGELAQRLGHQAGLEADVGVAHLALDLGARHERSHRVDHHHVHRARAHQVVGDLERLLACVGLRDMEVGDVHAQLLGVGRVQRVLGVDEHGVAARALRVRDDGERERGLARRLGAVDLDDAPARHAAHAGREVEAQRAGVDHVDPDLRALLAQLHDGALAELFLDLLEGEVQRLGLLLGRRWVDDHVCVSFAGAWNSRGCERARGPLAMEREQLEPARGAGAHA